MRIARRQLHNNNNGCRTGHVLDGGEVVDADDGVVARQQRIRRVTAPIERNSAWWLVVEGIKKWFIMTLTFRFML
jgi:hypothetical protein